MEKTTGDIGDMKDARAARLRANLELPMSERLAKAHALCKQMNAIKGAAKKR